MERESGISIPARRKIRRPRRHLPAILGCGVDYRRDNWLRCWFAGIDSEAVP